MRVGWDASGAGLVSGGAASSGESAVKDDTTTVLPELSETSASVSPAAFAALACLAKGLLLLLRTARSGVDQT